MKLEPTAILPPPAARADVPAFDSLAAGYDAAFTASALGRLLREMTSARLDAVLAGRSSVLEIGCGTGEDAVRLALRGARVVALDPAPAMLRVACEKARRMGCAQRIEFRCLPMERVGELGGARFDAVWSNFGAVNCVRQLDDAIAALAPLVAPGAPLVFVVMGRDVPWEWAWFLARNDPAKAFRRRQAGGVAWRGLRVAYPTPAELARALHPHFLPTRRAPLGVVLPPSYATGWLERRPRVLGALARLERAAHRCQPLATIADHYVFEARRAAPQRDA